MGTGELEHVDVVVVGAGPAGLVSAIGLAGQGVRTLLVERRERLSPLPRATGVSTRTFELLRAMGLEERVRAGAVEVASSGGLVTRTLADAADGVLAPVSFPTAEQAAALSPSRPGAVPQDHLEAVLLDHLRTLPAAEVRFGTELAASDQDPDGVTVVLREPPGGTLATVRARYLVGADGAHSTVRRQAGIAMRGPDHLAEQITVLFEAPLGEVVGERCYGIYFITDPAAHGVIVPSGAGRWLHGFEWDPAAETLADWTDERLAARIRAAAGVPWLRPRIVAHGAFSFAAQLADRFADGRILLVGDAAHRMTPRRAMGMNTAIHDAHHLAWKLAWVVRGWAGPDLLDTHEAERRPVAKRRVALSAEAGPERTPMGRSGAGGAGGPERTPMGRSGAGGAGGPEVGFDVLGALVDDLGGRVAHAWLAPPARNTSTLDLVGDGLTLFTGPAGSAWHRAAEALGGAGGEPPLVAHRLDADAADAVGAENGGAVLVRPDALVAASWPSVGLLGPPVEELRAAVEELRRPRSRV